MDKATDPVRASNCARPSTPARAGRGLPSETPCPKPLKRAAWAGGVSRGLTVREVRMARFQGRRFAYPVGGEVGTGGDRIAWEVSPGRRRSVGENFAERNGSPRGWGALLSLLPHPHDLPRGFNPFL